MRLRLLIPLCLMTARIGFWAGQLAWQPTASTPHPTPSQSKEVAQAIQGTLPGDRGGSEPAIPLSSTEASSSTPSPKSILEITRAAENEGLPPADVRLQFMETIASMRAEELEELIRQEASNPDFFRRMRFEFQFAAERLSEIAPQKAAELWLSSASLRFQTGALLSPWAARDPQAFVAWSLSLPADSQQATSAIIGSIAKNSPDTFASIAPLIVASPAAAPTARAAMEALMEKAGKGTPPDVALSLAKSLPEGPMRNSALAQLAKWPALSLESHPEILRAIESLPKSDAQRLGRDLSPKAEQLPAGPARQSAFAGNLRDLTQKNPTAATEKLNSLSGTPDYAAATRGFVEETSRNDPQSAMQWALSIPGDAPGSSDQRQLALDRAARSWMRANAEEARTWVNNAPISDREYFLLTGTQRDR